MTPTNTRVARLKQMLALEERRTALQQEIDSLVTQLNDIRKHLLEDNAPVVRAPAASPAGAASPAIRRGRRKGSKRGQVSANILSALKAAGSKGITVADLASKLGANYKNIYVWFATTGRKHPIKKLAPATYSLPA